MSRNRETVSEFKADKVIDGMFCLFCLIMNSIVQSMAQNDDFNIVGGQVAPVGRFPYIAALSDQIGDFPICGGILITPNAVLSAAHCGEIKEVFINCFNIRDRFLDDQNCERFLVEEQIIHPNYRQDSISEENDFAIIFLQEESITEPMKYLPSSSDFTIPENEDITIAGWGTTGFLNFNRPVTLRETIIQLVPEDTCNDLYRAEFDENLIQDNMFCASLPGRDSCQADSGGPAFFRCDFLEEDLLIGLISWGRRCAEPNFPGVYAKISSALDFISDAVESRGYSLSLFEGSFDDFCVANGSKAPTPERVPFEVPISWRCDDFRYASLDGCHCNCGAVDPDCFDERSSKRLFGCQEGEICSTAGVCSQPTSFPTLAPTVLSLTSRPSSFPSSFPTTISNSPPSALSSSSALSSLEVAAIVLSLLLFLLLALYILHCVFIKQTVVQEESEEQLQTSAVSEI